VAEYSRAGVSRTLRGEDPGVALTDAAGDLSDLAATIGIKPGSPPLLLGVSGGRFLKPLPVTQASSLTSVSRIDETHFLVVGRGVDGVGLAGIYTPLHWDFELLPRPAGRALTSSASRPERELALAVGAQGAVFRRQRGANLVSYLPEAVDLASVGVDVLGCAWAGGAGSLWVSPSAESGWHRAWASPDWRAPFVSVFAEPGLVMAAAADGAILEGRAVSEGRPSSPSWPSTRSSQR
jgi:hypothetical protein